MLTLVAVLAGCGDDKPAVTGETLLPSAAASGRHTRTTSSASPAATPAAQASAPQVSGSGSAPAPTSTQPSDATIRGDILVRLSQEPSLRDLEFKVRVRDGDVTLQGRVRTKAQKRTAEQIAVTEPGVRKVVSYIVVTARNGY